MSSSEKTREELTWDLVQASRWSSTGTVLLHHVIAESLGLNPTDHKCADIIAQKGPISAGVLGEITGLSSGTLTAVLDRLEKARFIQRIPDPYDRRRVLLEAIPDRHEELHEIFGIVGSAHEELLKAYDVEELKVILRYMNDTITFAFKQTQVLREYAKAKNEEK